MVASRLPREAMRAMLGKLDRPDKLGSGTAMISPDHWNNRCAYVRSNHGTAMAGELDHDAVAVSISRIDLELRKKGYCRRKSRFGTARPGGSYRGRKVFAHVGWETSFGGRCSE